MSQATLGPSVIICAYSMERFEDTCRAMASAYLQSLPPLEVILCVDHNEELAARFESLFGTHPRVVRNEGDRGLSASRNLGSAVAVGEILAFMDDDAEADYEWLEHLLAPFAEPRVAAVGGCVLPKWHASGRPTWLAEEFDWLVACTYRGMPVSADNQMRNVIGCNMAFRHSVLDSVGWFNPSLGRVGKYTGQAEETELCIRIRRDLPLARIIYEPRAVVHHKVPPERLEFGFLVRRSFNEGFFKARMQDLAGPAKAGLSTEREYLKHLVAHFMSERIKRLYRPDAAAQLAAGVLCVVAVLVGVIMGKLKSTQ